MVTFTVRSLNLWKRHDLCHVVTKNEKKYFSFPGPEYCTIEDGKGNVDVLFYPPTTLEELYYNHNYQFLGEIDPQDLIDLTYIDPGYWVE